MISHESGRQLSSSQKEKSFFVSGQHLIVNPSRHVYSFIFGAQKEIISLRELGPKQTPTFRVKITAFRGPFSSDPALHHSTTLFIVRLLSIRCSHDATFCTNVYRALISVYL